MEEGSKMSTSRAADLLAAALCGDIARLQTLLPIAGDLTAFAALDGVTPLMAAASGGHEAVVELLLERGSNPARRDVKGRSAAAYARAAGHTHLAARLDGVVDQEKTLR
jgi:ankyrin repeat protein